MCTFFPMKESYSAVTSLVRFKVYVERAQEDATNGWEERGRRKTLTQHITWSGRQGETSRERRGGGLKSSREREGDGERSSLGNLFWSSQSADTQGAGKPITV